MQTRSNAPCSGVGCVCAACSRPHARGSLRAELARQGLVMFALQRAAGTHQHALHLAAAALLVRISELLCRRACEECAVRHYLWRPDESTRVRLAAGKAQQAL